MFAALSGGVYLLRAEMPGYSDAEIPALFIGPNDTKTVDLTLLATNTAASQAASARSPEFFDEPQFTVAGVTDTTSLGGHGSDTIVRTRESIAKETVSLGKAPANSARTADYEKERDRLLTLLARSDKAELHHSLGDVQEKLGDSLDAVREYQRAAELDPTESYLFDWGSELLLHHAPEPAAEVFTRGNRLFPHSVRMLIGLGAAWFARGSYDQAVQRICQASDLNPKDSMPYLFLGRIQSAETSTSAEVVEKLRRFVTQEPQNADANYYYAVSLWKQRTGPQDTANSAQIEALLGKAIRLDPKFAAAYLQLGILHAEQKDYARAISNYQQAIQANPQMQIQTEEAHFASPRPIVRSGMRPALKPNFRPVARSTKNWRRKRNASAMRSVNSCTLCATNLRPKPRKLRPTPVRRGLRPANLRFQAPLRLSLCYTFCFITDRLLHAGRAIHTCFFPRNMWAIWPAKSPRN